MSETNYNDYLKTHAAKQLKAFMALYGESQLDDQQEHIAFNYLMKSEGLTAKREKGQDNE